MSTPAPEDISYLRPFVGKDADLILGDEATGPNFKCQVKSWSLDADTETLTEEALCLDGVYQDVADPTWTLNIEALNGRIVAPEGQSTVQQALFKYLFAHHGELVDFTVRPHSGVLTEGMTGRLTIKVGDSYGVAKKAMSTFNAALPVTGQPEHLDGTKLSSAVTP